MSAPTTAELVARTHQALSPKPLPERTLKGPHGGFRQRALCLYLTFLLNRPIERVEPRLSQYTFESTYPLFWHVEREIERCGLLTHEEIASSFDREAFRRWLGDLRARIVPTKADRRLARERAKAEKAQKAAEEEARGRSAALRGRPRGPRRWPPGGSGDARARCLRAGPPRRLPRMARHLEHPRLPHGPRRVGARGPRGASCAPWPPGRGLPRARPGRLADGPRAGTGRSQTGCPAAARARATRGRRRALGSLTRPAGVLFVPLRRNARRETFLLAAGLRPEEEAQAGCSSRKPRRRPWDFRAFPQVSLPLRRASARASSAFSGCRLRAFGRSVRAYCAVARAAEGT